MKKSRFLSAALVILALGGCGDVVGEAPPPSYAAPGSDSLEFFAAEACQLDSDCDPGAYCFRGVCATECLGDGDCGELSCDERGRCAPPEGLAPTADETASGTRIVTRPDPVIRVQRDQRLVQVSFTLDGPTPDEGLRWRVERSDLATDPARVFHGPADNPVRIMLAPGDASPAADRPRPVDVSIISSAGTVRVTLAPTLAQDGAYAGEATMAHFGQAGLPLEVQVVTDPPGSAIAAATSAWLVLPVQAGHVFNPVPHRAEGSERVARPLVYDDFARAWVAQFDLPYPLTSDLFAWSSELPVTRSMRFELNPTSQGGLTGAMVDRWSGLKDRRSRTGVVTSDDIVFQGSLRLSRVGAAPALEQVVPPVDYEVVAPRRLPPPALSACEALTLPDAWVDVAACEGLSGTSDWVRTDASSRAGCAVAFAEDALARDPLSATLQAFLSGGAGSFADFIAGCADGSEAACSPPEVLLCARELSAHALYLAPDESTEALVRVHSLSTHGAAMGTQLAAYYADSHTRAAWLSDQTYPSLLASEVTAHASSLLDSWERDVLDAHFAVLARELDVAGLTAYSAEVAPDGGPVDSSRATLALGMTQGFRAATDSLSLLVHRWNELHRDDAARAEAAARARARATDLYLSAGLIASLNEAAGQGSLNASLGAGFGGLMSAMHQLALPFNGLLLERQGTVAVSTSLDPSTGNEGLLASLEEDALDEVGRAQLFIDTLLDEAREEALQRALLGQRLENEQADVHLELASLCGFPVGCTLSTLGDPGCEVPIEAGRCGFRIDVTTGDVLEGSPDDLAPSDASAAILAVQGAAGALRAAEEERRRHYDEVLRHHGTTEFFAQQASAWHEAREALAMQIDDRLVTLAASGQADLAAFAAGLAEHNSVRRAQLETRRQDLVEWDELRTDSASAYMSEIVRSATLRSRADTGESAAGFVVAHSNALAEGYPVTAGSSFDLTSGQRSAVKYAGIATAVGLVATAAVLTRESLLIEQAAEEKRLLDEAAVRNLELSAELETATVEADIAEARDALELAAGRSSAEAEAARDVLDALERDRANAESYDRDLFALRERRDALLNLLQEGTGQDLAIQQARRTVRQRVHAYAQVTARAGLLSSKLETLQGQAAHVNGLVGSPAAFFAWANDLTLAESRLARAKSRVMDWLVGLEYFAVRPFMSERLAVLLATNTHQLDQVAARLSDLQDDCGGAVNTSTVELSVRDLLGIQASRVDSLTGEQLSPAQVFRALLAEARVPIDRSVRYRADANVGSLLARGDALAVSFRLGVDDFANLSTTCNAKVLSLGVQIVGEELGDALPTVSVLYDGTSVLRSCQPDIEAIVEQVGRDMTPFGQLTEFRTPGRSIAPISGVNDFRDRMDDNTTLGGLPLVSEYTLLIDVTTGENDAIDWDRLEDIRLRLSYSYQDLFPSGQCGETAAP